MKTTHTAALIVLSILALGASAQPPPPPRQGLRAIRQDLPGFPIGLIQHGVTEGEARVAIVVNPAGKIDDYLVLAYTHPEFARLTVEALKDWTFEPACIRGIAVSAETEVSAHFRSQGTVVSLSTTDMMHQWAYPPNQSDASYRPHSLRELDRIPKPIVAPSPPYPIESAGRSHPESVKVQFYIDEAGTARMPSADADQDTELAALAVSAVRQWKFEPPMRGGKPVLVRASQVFRFPLHKASAAGKSAGANAGVIRQ